MKADRKEWIWYGIVSLIYILWVIWLRNYWFLLGLPIIFDLYITKKVNWTFWKKRDGKNSKVVEWLDALIFAVVAVSHYQYLSVSELQDPNRFYGKNPADR